MDMVSGICRLGIGVAIIVLLAGCGKAPDAAPAPAAGADKAVKSDKTAPVKAPPSKEEATAAAEPAFKLTSDAWHAEWKKDTAAARTKYGKKVIQLDGTVEVVMPDGHGKYGLVRLNAGDNITVLCNTLDREPWWKVSAGSKVTIKGTASADAKEGDLLDCIIVKADKNPAPTVKATQISKELAGNKDEARDKYDDNWVILEGELLETKPANNQLVIKGEGPAKIVCTFSANAIDKERMDALKAGQTVKVVGKAAVRDDIALKYCMMSAKGKK
jgi:hypothetical protein